MSAGPSKIKKEPKVSRYSVSFQEDGYITDEIAPLLPDDDGDIDGRGTPRSLRSYRLAGRELTHGDSDAFETPSPTGSRKHSVDGTLTIQPNYDSVGKDNAHHNGDLPIVVIATTDGGNGHCHNNNKGEDASTRSARRRLILASIVCLFFMVAEIIGGYLSHSLAIMTDAAHLLTDFASFMISLFSLWLATRPATKRMSFGYYRAEVIGALTSVLMIWVVTGILVYLATIRIINRDYEIDAQIMLITSGVAIAVNIVMGVTLHNGHHHGHGGHDHSHGGHDHDHKHKHDVENSTSITNVQSTVTAAETEVDLSKASVKQQAPPQVHQYQHQSHQDRVNINVRAAFIHVLGDLLQSVGVFIAALIIYLRPELVIVDPICTYIFSLFVLVTTFAIMKDTLQVLMEGMPKGIDFNEVYQTFFHINGVVRVHNLRVWSLSMEKIALSAHVVIGPGVSATDVLRDASNLVRDRYSFFEMTLQIEDYKDEMQDCTDCQSPAP